MAHWQYDNPVAVHFGAGVLDSLPSVLRGRKASIVTFPEAKGFGLLPRLEKLVGASLVGVIDQTQPNPDVDGLDTLYRAFWREQRESEVIVAVGGGSALDTAKALMVGTESGEFDALVTLLATGKPFTPHKVKTLIAVPTTSGTGSEVTGWATVWNRAAGKKYSLHLPETWPEAALVDPELTLSLPAGPTLAAGLDALSHALESIWNINANPVSHNHAVAAARLVLATLPALMKNRAGALDLLRHDDAPRPAARHRLLVHARLQRAIGKSAERDAVLARVFDVPLAQAPAVLHDFLEGLGVSTRFESYGVTEAESARMITNALDGVRGRNFIGVASAATTTGATA